MNMMPIDLAGRNVARVGEDEQVCSIELNTLLWSSNFLHPSVHIKNGSEVNVVLAVGCTWVDGCS